MKYLKSKKYYQDLYDLFTIKECLRLEKQFSQPSKTTKKVKASEKDKLRARFMVRNLFFYHTKGDRYKKKAETIDKWIEANRLRDEKLENTHYSREIYCDHCDQQLELETKHLHDIDINKLRVLFFFKCSECNKKRAIYENGEEFEYDRTCPECKKGEIKSKYSRKGKVITTIDSCSDCDYKEKEIMDLDKNKLERKQREKFDKELLIKFRNEYCLSKKEGQKYIGEIERLKALKSLIDEQQKKQADPRYHKAKKLKKTTVVQLEKALKKTLEKEKYINLQLDKPEIGVQVVIPFTVQDAKNKREEYNSRQQLKKLIKTTLKKTNWRLMSEGVNYRLGYLSGRLKGYEREEDLVNLFGNK